MEWNGTQWHGMERNGTERTGRMDELMSEGRQQGRQKKTRQEGHEDEGRHFYWDICGWSPLGGFLSEALSILARAARWQEALELLRAGEVRPLQSNHWGFDFGGWEKGPVFFCFLPLLSNPLISPIRVWWVSARNRKD